MSNNEPIKLRIPRQDLAEFTLFGLTAEQASAWADGLPMANSAQVAQQLRLAIGDLPQRIDRVHRFAVGVDAVELVGPLQVARAEGSAVASTRIVAGREWPQVRK